MNFKSIVDLLTYFSDETKAVEYYENIRWGDEPACPHCGSVKPYKTNRGYKCREKECHKKFTVRTGTIFENSKIPFRVWFAAIYLATSSSKGVSSVQLARQVGVTQKTAWFVLHRIREMLKDKAPTMLGEKSAVEADEAYIGQKDQNKHFNKRRSADNKLLTNDGSPYKDKRAVLGVIERNGKVVLKHVPNATKENMVAFIEKHVPKGSKLYTDEFRGYASLGRTYDHATVKHALNVYVAGDVHTNTIENFWSILKRGLYGIYHSVSDKHLERYLDEFAARFNNRLLGEEGKFVKFLEDSESPLSYKRLTGRPV
ncbi:IS1595 family transposase [Ekhidna sp.]|uniref:IS1595 family transposase n=1 Tax=Ekhidna sp. TaxID=2608089 RepID=UPI0032ECEA8D